MTDLQDSYKDMAICEMAISLGVDVEQATDRLNKNRKFIIVINQELARRARLN